MKAPGALDARRLRLECHELLSNCAFKSNLRRYSVALLDCAVPLPMILPEPAKVARDAAAAATAAKEKKGGKKGGGGAAAATKVVGLEWCAENGSPLLEVATLSAPGGGRGGKRAAPAHLKARLGLMVSREGAAPAPGSPAVKRLNIRRLLQEAAAAGEAAAASAPQPWCVTGVIRVPAADDFLRYHSHPAAVDNSMQLVAALAAGASKVPLPLSLPLPMPLPLPLPSQVHTVKHNLLSNTSGLHHT